MTKKQTKNINIPLDRAKPVYVYHNSNKQCWSIKQNGKVILHTNHVYLEDCEFKVNKSGREKSIKSGRKTFHAYVKGYVTIPKTYTDSSDIEIIRYDREVNDSFYYNNFELNCMTPVYKAGYLYMQAGYNGTMLIGAGII